MEMIRKTYAAEVKGFDRENLIVEHFISTESPDRTGDIVRAKGMNLRGRPVVLLQHGRDFVMGAEPIARALGFDKKAEFKGVPGVMAKTQFFPDETGQRLFEKNVGGFMPNWSIGFIPIKTRPIINEETKQETGREIMEWELLEYSLVAVPAQPDAATPPGKKEGIGEIRFKFFPESKMSETHLCGSCGKEYIAIEIDREKAIGIEKGCPECNPAIPGLDVVMCDHLAALRKHLPVEISVTPDWRTDKADEEWTPADAKPYPGEHACRVNDPGKYDRIRRQNDKFGKGIHAIWGIKASKTEIQAIRFDRTKFSVDQAKKWLADHDIKCKSFEAASGKDLEDGTEILKAAIDGLACAMEKLTESMTDMCKKIGTMDDKIEALAAKEGDPAPSGEGGDKNNPQGRGNGAEVISGERAAVLIGSMAKRAAQERIRKAIDKMKGKVE